MTEAEAASSVILFFAALLDLGVGVHDDDEGDTTDIEEVGEAADVVDEDW